MEVGERIRVRREELGMTQDDLAKKVGYKSRSAVAKLEANANGMVQSKLLLFADALQTTPAYLLGWEDTASKNDRIADIIIRLRTDDTFMDAVDTLYKLEPEQFATINNVLTAFKQQSTQEWDANDNR